MNQSLTRAAASCSSARVRVFCVCVVLGHVLAGMLGGPKALHPVVSTPNFYDLSTYIGSSYTPRHALRHDHDALLR